MYDLFYAVEYKGHFQLRMVDSHECVISVTDKDRFKDCIKELVHKYHNNVGAILDLHDRLSPAEITRREAQYMDRDEDLQSLVEKTICEAQKEYKSSKPQSTGKKKFVSTKKKQEIIPEPVFSTVEKKTVIKKVKEKTKEVIAPRKKLILI